MSGYTYRVRSQPEYSEFRWDGGGARHLLVLAAIDEASRAAILARPCPGPLQVLADNGTCADLARQLAARGAAVELLPDSDAWLARLRTILASAAMGLRLYAVGPEDAIWRAAAEGRALGMSRDEMHLHRAGTLARPVHCVHCGSRLPGVHHNVAPCAHCGRMLLVRDHFSRLHGAYMGVQADAEQPGVLPPQQEVFP